MNDFQLIAELQGFFSLFDSMLRWLSLHAYSKHYLLLTAILYWTGHQVLAIRLACATLVSTLVFGSLRHFFASPRPYWLEPSMFNGVKEGGYGMPSGHTQNAITFWGLTAWSLKKTLITVMAVLIIAIIALSRLYLGVHFPLQVLIGCSIGLGIVVIWSQCETKTVRWLKNRSVPTRLTVVSLASLLPLLITVSLREIGNLGDGSNSATPYAFISLLTGLLLGISASLTIKQNNTVPRLSPWLLFFTRAIPGAIITLILWQQTSSTPTTISQPMFIYSYCLIRGFLFSVWAILLWPWLYRLLVTKILSKTRTSTV
ncbi:phosphatase PAP2 family protein [Endozoicomonas sp. Mp262]|uniref:phosphatase PAP2 family protein n=1 Tax=Endozoicomonas sp. Mp262 TaxID=2919499 RepID=UPI0021E0C24D